jgi:peptidoglycan/LPS O-acetylase OafA/YrhL
MNKAISLAPNSSQDYLPHVDGLRAIAVLSVLLFHLHLPGFKGGFVGVDIFLVISGLLISRLILKELQQTGRFSFRNFYLRRIRRIVPALLVTQMVTACLMALILSPTHLEQFGGSLLTASFGVSNIFFWLEADYFGTASQFKPLLHTWSLGVEEQFYLFWPLFLAVVYRLRLHRGLPLLMLVVGGISLWLNKPFSDGHVGQLTSMAPEIAKYFSDGKSTLFYLLPFRVYEFALGGIMVFAMRFVPKNRNLLDTMFVLGLAMIVWAVGTFDKEMLFPMSAALIPCGGAALLIAAGKESRFSVLLNHRVVVFIGLISYSLYLVHWPLIVASNYLFGPPGYLAVAVLTVLSFVLAWASWRYVEKPFRQTDFWSSHPAAYVLCPMLFLITIGVGWHMQHSNGWNFRVPHTLAHMEFKGDSAAFHRTHYGGAGYSRNGGVETDAPPDVVLIGDSHGLHYAEGLYVEWARPRGLSMYVSAGSSCFYLPGFTRITPGVDWDTVAPKALNRALDIIHSAEKPPVVIISHAWVTQLTLAGILDEEGHARPRAATEKDLIEGLLALKQEIGDAPLVVIGQVPTTNGIDLHDKFTQPWLVQKYFNDASDFVFSNPSQQSVEFNEKLRRVADETGAYIFLDPFDALRAENGCRNLDDEQRLIYSDQTHLSKVGSCFVVRHFLPELDRALASRKLSPRGLRP